MNCPICRRPSAVINTVPSDRAIRRRRACDCGARWNTVERRTGTVLTPTNSGSGPPLIADQPPTNSSGGVGGGLSADLSVSGSLSASLEDPDPILDRDRRSDRAREDGYSREFLVFWMSYPRKEAKGAAWKAWKRLNPPLPDILNALSWQRTTLDWTKENGKYVPLPASYLNATRWEDQRRSTRQDSGGPFYRKLA